MRRLSALALLLTSAFGQSVAEIDSFYEELLTSPPSAEVPLVKLTALLEPLETAPRPDVARIVKAVAAGLGHPSRHVRSACSVALFSVVLRPDSAELLSPYLGQLASLLNSAEDPTADTGLMLFAYMRPAPPAEALPIVRAFIARTDRNTTRQARAVSILLRDGRDDPATLPAIERFAQRDLDVVARTQLFDSIALALPKDPRLVAIVGQGLADPREGVRKRSIYDLIQMGPQFIADSAPTLQRLRVEDPAPEVRAEADRALRVMVGEPRNTK